MQEFRETGFVFDTCEFDFYVHFFKTIFIVFQSTSALNSQPLVALSQTMNTRLTHLILAHNKIAGFMQIVAALAVRTLF